jgi:hypothetical protein
MTKFEQQFFCCIAICAIVGCSNVKHSSDKKGKVSTSGTDILSHQRPLLLTNETLHHFSSTAIKDTFRIVVTGASVAKGDFRFQIISPELGIVYDQSYTTQWLLDYGAEKDTTTTFKEHYIKQRIKKFFEAEKFSQPAIDATEKFDSYVSEATAWEMIKADPEAIGFYYLVGKEDGRKIAYSKTLRRVVLYYNCC